MAPPSGRVIEIGAGSGALTGRLLGLELQVTAIEIDPRLAAWLRSTYPQAEVLEADILELELRDLAGAGAAVAGNLPYYITSPILRRIFTACGAVSAAAVLVQKEVAARITAEPGSRDYGYLSVLCQAHGRPRLAFPVPPGAFRPQPKVFSAFVTLPIEPRWTQWGVEDLEGFLGFARLCFRQKRKTLLNNLQARFGRERLSDLPECRLRAEQLSPERLAALWLRLAGKGAEW